MIALILTAMLAAVPPGSIDRKRDDGCTVALSYFTAELADKRFNKRVVYSLRPAFVGPAGMVDTQWFKSGNESALPAPDDLRAQLFLNNVSAIAECPSVQALLRVHRIKFGKRAVTTAQWDNRTRRRLTTIVHISLPVLSADAQEAVMAVETDGGAWSAYLQRGSNGSWKTVANSSGIVF